MQEFLTVLAKNSPILAPAQTLTREEPDIRSVLVEEGFTQAFEFVRT